MKPSGNHCTAEKTPRKWMLRVWKRSFLCLSLYSIFSGRCRALYQVTATLGGSGGSLSNATWNVLEPFIYRSGSVYPPKLLRTTPEQNYLNPALRAIGLALMALALLTSVAASIWIFFRRKHPVVRKAQPFALHLICFGSFVSSCGIFPLSFDESYGWTQNQLNSGCMSVPWFASIGHIITYGGTSLLIALASLVDVDKAMLLIPQYAASLSNTTPAPPLFQHCSQRYALTDFPVFD